MPLPTALVRFLFTSLALALVATAAMAITPPVVTGQVVYQGQLMSGTNLNSGDDQNANVQVYLEDPQVTLSAALPVDRIGPNFGTFEDSGSGSGSIPKGTQVTDYLLHYD